MTQLKAFAMLVIVAMGADWAAFDGVYRRAFGRGVNHAVYQISHMNWTGGFF